MKIGDTIKCHDKEELINLMMLLQEEGIMTEPFYKKRLRRGFWLRIVGFKWDE